MKQTINEYDFRRAFETLRPDNFSYEGLGALYEYLTDLEDDTGQEIELDVIAICCDYTEYASLTEFQSDYSDEYDSIETIEDNTSVIRIDDDRFIIQAF